MTATRTKADQESRSGALVGYARVSTREQHPEGQIDRLTDSGCERVFVDKVSGTKSSRPQWDECCRCLRRGDTLVITSLDRAGRSVKHLAEIADDLHARGVNLRVLDQSLDTGTAAGKMLVHVLATIAEFEHNLIVERVNDGLAAARARGRKGGRRPVLTDSKRMRLQELYDARELTVAEIAKTIGVSETTLYRHLGTDAQGQPRKMRRGQRDLT